ncbi:hypothetical protein [Myxosarcina sp. GI1]|uniref:hypothetical protein n=1 Tax=Myxosarcina sp. GI1 TaxID=1541065 RepID=UPI0005657F7C|nr:hypothetical protein [Myxosarcina sp. GI1]
MSPSSNTSASNYNSHNSDKIVHKPFATGEINIFRPFKGKIDRRREITTPITDGLETATTDTLISSQLKWQNRIFNVWSLGAIAIVLLTNAIAIGTIKMRNAQQAAAPVKTQRPTIGHRDLTANEFMPLDLSTLSNLPSAEKPQANEESELVPQSLIPPAFVPFNNNTFLARSDRYHYVLTEYAGDRSLEFVREKLTNISLVHLPEGMFVYLGAFVEREPANNFILKLRQEGIEAKIYPFE